MTLFMLDPATDVVASVPRTKQPYQKRGYCDKQFPGGEEAWRKALSLSSTVYVGNLSCYTNEYQLYELFSRCGSIKRVIMGLDAFKKTPCGFCFVEYDDRSAALKSISYLNGCHLDGRDMKVNIDAGFREGRQYGRGSTGGQISDERRRDRERDEFGNYIQPNKGYQIQPTQILTRSITVVACLAMISLLLVAQSHETVHAKKLVIKPIPLFTFGGFKMTAFDNGRYLNSNGIRQAQSSQDRAKFETDLAQFLVNMMKSAKPTLMTAFIQATLADKQLKEIAIGLFFNSTSNDSDSR